MEFTKPGDIEALIGKEIGVSDWVAVDQDRIDQFADVTEDHQFIHVDPEAAKKTPFGTTVAHGFLTLSLLSKFATGNTLTVEGVKMGVNYGFEKVRFVAPVKCDSRVRGRFTLMDAKQRIPGQWSLKYAAKVEIEGEEKPALLAEWLVLQFV